MRGWNRVWGTLLCAWALASAQATVPLEAYGRLPNLEDVALSPDGTKLAYVSTTSDTRAVRVMSLQDRRLLSSSSLGEFKLRQLSWADDDHLLMVTSEPSRPWDFSGETREWYLLSVFQLSSRRLRQYPTPISGLRILNVVSGHIMVRRIGADTVLFIPGFYASGRRKLPALLKVNLRTGAESVVRMGSESTTRWLVDDAGDVVAESSYFEQGQRWELKIRRDGRLVEAQSLPAAIDVPRMLGFGPDPDTLLIQNMEDGDPVWRLLSLRDGQLGPPMEERASMSQPIEDPRTHYMIGGLQILDEIRYVFFDQDLRNRWASIVHAFEGERVRLMSTSADLMKFVVRVEGARHGYQYQLVDMSTAGARSLGRVYEDVGQLFEVRRISYNAADGMKIPAYLTLPAEKTSRLPLIVFPHGGPAVRDTPDFNWWAQAMASRGYAVLQPNFRGSALDWKFLSAGFGEWGRKMQTDLSDGVRYLDSQGIIDPKRVCIIGASYGGYAALAGVTLDPGVYRCAVSVAGISDPKAFLQWVRRRDVGADHLSERYWDRFLAGDNPGTADLGAISPVKHAERVTVPVMLIHGKEDTVVPYAQSEVMYDALRKAHRKVELVTLRREDHWLSRSATRLQMLQSAMAFIEANNPSD
jgi:dienelactone hydrolase